MKAASIGALAALAAIFAFLTYGPLSNLWGYQDSSTGTYLLYGLPPLVLSLLALAVIAVVARR